MVIHLFKRYLGYMLVNLRKLFYRLSSLFAQEGFLSSVSGGNTTLREVSVFLGICLFFLGSRAKSQKLQEQNSGSAKDYMLCSVSRHFISHFKVPLRQLTRQIK